MGAAAPLTNIAAALSCTHLPDREVAGSLSASAGSRSGGPGAVKGESADPAEPLLLLASGWTRPALEWKPSSECDPSVFVPFSSSLSSSDPSDSSSLSSPHSRREVSAAPKEEPPTPCSAELEATGLSVSAGPTAEEAAPESDSIA